MPLNSKAMARLESIYSLYPRKMGKSQGFRIAVSKIKSLKDMNDLEQAVLNYTKHVESEGTEKQFIMYFGTFMGQFRDWLEPDIGTVSVNQIDLSGIEFDK